MAKYETKPNSRVSQIFEDLENYLEFCKQFGYKFDERELYNNKSYVYRQFAKYLKGELVKDMWEVDAKA